MTKQKYVIPDSKLCDWCGVSFSPVNYKQRFCSGSCAVVFRNRSPGKHDCGPCPTCGKMFKSKDRKKVFCSMDCYVASDQYAALHNANLNKLNPNHGKPRVCHGCGSEFSRANRRKYCTNTCRRRYFTERFDRWIANPESVALPQNFDEFLSRNILSCPVDGCGWEGEFLGSHVNHAHGISAREFKKLCGFNISTGLVGTDLAKHFSERTEQRIADGSLLLGFSDSLREPAVRENYKSLEGKEHAKKSRAESPQFSGKFLPCRECGIEVPQLYYGKKMYCSPTCRSKWYSHQNVDECQCAFCGKQFVGSRRQTSRYKKALPVCCGTACRCKFAQAAKVIATCYRG